VSSGLNRNGHDMDPCSRSLQQWHGGVPPHHLPVLFHLHTNSVCGNSDVLVVLTYCDTLCLFVGGWGDGMYKCTGKWWS
jgi:hypothetical protein